MQKRKIFVLMGCEYKDSTPGMLADTYERAAISAGFTVRRMNIGDMKFDPLLHYGYKMIQPLEPDLKTFQENVKWCDHFVIVYPLWWGSMPAILKGLFDRTWLPAFAFHFHPDKHYAWDKLLRGRSARVIISMNANPFLERFMMGDYTNEIRTGILQFAGFSPVALTTFGPCEKAPATKLESWAAKAENLGTAGV